MSTHSTSQADVGATAAKYFGAMIDSYDSLIRRAVPRYAEMTERLLEYLPPDTAAVLELGCGTGNLSLKLAAKYPHARLTLVDASPEMIDVTRTRLTEAYPEVARQATFRVMKFEDVSPHDGRFDVITSCISLHHVVDKGRLFLQLHETLADGGTFRFADQMAGASDTRNGELNWSKWLEFCRQPGNCSEEEVQSLVDHAAAHDHYAPIVEQIHLLEKAGFVNVDCVWRNWMWGIITAERSKSK